MRTAKLIVLMACLSTTVAARSLQDIFLIGDSISIHYTPYLAADVAHRFLLTRKGGMASGDSALDDSATNGGDSRMVLAYLKNRYREPAFRPHIVLLNCGLHDVKRDPKTNVLAIPAPEYRKNLEEIEKLIREKHAKLIWISSTPVDDAIHNSKMADFHRFNADVVAYNSIASKIFFERHVPMIDLYRFTRNLGSGHYVDHVHFDQSTRSLQAAYIAGYLDSWAHAAR